VSQSDDKDIALVDLQVPVHVTCVQDVSLLDVDGCCLDRFDVKEVACGLIRWRWFYREQEWRSR